MTNTTTPILSLPSELLGAIFTMVPDCKSKACFMRSCSAFRDIAVYYCCDTEQRALVNAVVQRALTQEEVDVSFRGRFNSDREQICSLESKFATEQAISNFYAALKNRCIPSNFDLHNIGFLFVYIGLKYKFNASADVVLTVKMGTTYAALAEKIYIDMVGAFVGQPAEYITIQSYCKKAKDIQGDVEVKSIVTIEASLRQALIAKHDQAFKALSDEFLDASVDNPRIREIQEQVKIQREAERAAIEAELLALRGPSGSDGMINETHTELKYAQMELDAAKTMFLPAYAAAYGLRSTTAQIDQLMGFDFAPKPEVQAAKNNVLAKIPEFRSLTAEFDCLTARLSELAQFDHTGELIGGRLAQVLADLADLGSAARAEATRIGQFYSELQIPVTADNQQVRYDAIHSIIGG